MAKVKTNGSLAKKSMALILDKLAANQLIVS
jgi:hypothetical protein